MKKIIYTLILPLVVVSGLVFANREIKNETSKKSTPKPLSAAERKAVLEKWEATPDGIMYKKWEASPAGKKVLASAAKIRKSISDYTNMEGVVTSLSLPPGSRLGFGVMLRINGDDYILAFGPEKSGRTHFTCNIHKRLSLPDAVVPVRSGTGRQAGIVPENTIKCRNPNITFFILNDISGDCVRSVGSDCIF